MYKKFLRTFVLITVMSQAVGAAPIGEEKGRPAPPTRQRMQRDSSAQFEEELRRCQTETTFGAKRGKDELCCAVLMTVWTGGLCLPWLLYVVFCTDGENDGSVAGEKVAESALEQIAGSL